MRHRCRRGHTIRQGTWLAGAALVLLGDPAARAFDLDLRAQAQALALGGMSLPDPGFGTVELQVNGSLYSLGAALGVAYDRFPVDGGGTAHGGEFHAAFQWRFLALVDAETYGYFDPHLDLGFVLGGGREGGESWFRGAGYGGLGLDIGFLPEGHGGHVVLTIQYRWSPTGLHAPDAAPDHLLLFGLGLRGADV